SVYSPGATPAAVNVRSGPTSSRVVTGGRDGGPSIRVNRTTSGCGMAPGYPSTTRPLTVTPAARATGAGDSWAIALSMAPKANQHENRLNSSRRVVMVARGPAPRFQQAEARGCIGLLR